MKARQVAFEDYRRWLIDVAGAVQKEDAHADRRLRRLWDEFRHRSHPTVWAEMIRQRADLPEIDALLSAVSGVLHPER